MSGEWGASCSTLRALEKTLVASAFIQGEKEDWKTKHREMAGVLMVHRKRPCLNDLLLLFPTGSTHAILICCRNVISLFQEAFGGESPQRHV